MIDLLGPTLRKCKESSGNSAYNRYLPLWMVHSGQGEALLAGRYFAAFGPWVVMEKLSYIPHPQSP